jgi:hypothetical protein
MDPRKLIMDERLTGCCVYCGGLHETDDHVPSKVLLDEPFPPDLPTVPACDACNNGFSADERYVACLVECVVAGTVEPAAIRRDKVRRIISERPDIASGIAACRREPEPGKFLWDPDPKSVRNVVLKLARGHAAYECGEPRHDEPEHVAILPLIAMPDRDRLLFETTPAVDVWPEIGSRAFMRAVEGGPERYRDDGWCVVQEGRYRYLVASSGLMVRAVIGEYLAFEVAW